MIALRFHDGRPRVEEADDPVPAPGEALVGVRLAGICGTDLEIAAGYMAFRGIPGHEFVGVVEEAPDAPSWIGTRVVGEINVACGSCAFCLRDLRRHCPARTVLGIAGRDGAFARRLVLPLANLHAVPEEVTDEAAVFAEPLAAAWEVVDRLHPPPGCHALVLGAGRLGQLCAEALACAGSRPVVCVRSPAKLERLRRRGFVAVSDAAPLAPFDLVVEATGSPDGLARAISLVRPRGTIALKTTAHGDSTLDLAPLVVNEIAVVGSRCGPFDAALRHLSADLSLTEGLVSGRYPLRDAARAFDHARRPDALKVILDVAG